MDWHHLSEFKRLDFSEPEFCATAEGTLLNDVLSRLLHSSVKWIAMGKLDKVFVERCCLAATLDWVAQGETKEKLVGTFFGSDLTSGMTVSHCKISSCNDSCKQLQPVAEIISLDT